MENTNPYLAIKHTQIKETCFSLPSNLQVISSSSSVSQVSSDTPVPKYRPLSFLVKKHLEGMNDTMTPLTRFFQTGELCISFYYLLL